MHFKTDCKIVDRPGYFGKKRKEKESEYTYLYGCAWDECWEFGDYILTFDEAILLYDESYYQFIKNSIDLNWLTSFAECYDSDKNNIFCGLHHNPLAVPRHLQDVSVRRALIKLGTYFKKFRGTSHFNYTDDELLHIRGEESNGHCLMPGNVPFHLPQLLNTTNNNVKEWAKQNSVEFFWQANKVIIQFK